MAKKRKTSKSSKSKPGRGRGTRSRTTPRRVGPRTGHELNDALVERALITGEHRALLESYFGEENYEELRLLAARAQSARVRGGPRVLILPGIMGSKLGEAHLVFDDVIWVDFADILAGRLAELSLENGNDHVEAVGVILIAYLMLKWRLNLAGFDASFYAYDWRQSIDALGDELATHIRQETEGSRRSPQISLVAHSMGGLVSRAAFETLGNQRSRVQRLIMLGTPNFGSFAPVAALRGTHSLLRKMAAIDIHHSVDQLNRVFDTFPALYQMLPWREKFTMFDFYDPAIWPSVGPQPRASILEDAPSVQSQLSRGHERFTLIAGVNRETVTSARIGDDEFVYTTSLDGDGTVPVAFAELDEVKTYYVDEQHGALPTNGRVTRAVIEILETGTTDVLPDRWERDRHAPLRELTDRQLQEEEVFAGRTGDQVSPSEFRHVLDDFAAPPERPEVTAVPAQAAERTVDVTEQPITVGRRLQHRIDLRLAQGSITNVDARAIVVGVFRGVAPGGPAKAIDAQFGGAIAEFAERRMLSGGAGEVFVMPSARHSIPAEMVLFAGMGTYTEFNAEVLRLVVDNVARTLVRTKVEDFATVLLGAGSGMGVRDVLANTLQGLFRGLHDADHHRRVRSITFVEKNPQRYHELRSEVLDLASTALFDEVEVTVEELELPRVRAASPAVSLDAPTPDPVYLFAREISPRDTSTRRPSDTFVLQASVLTAGNKATVVTDVTEVDPARLDAHLEQIEKRSFGFQSLEAFGSELANLVLPPLVVAVLKSIPDRHVVVIHDATAARIPWETLRIDDRFLARQPGLSRKYEAVDLSVAKWLEGRRLDRTLNVLLVVNPTEDLPGAELEGERVRTLLSNEPSIEIDQLRRSEATWTSVRAAFRSGKYDIVHYAGHAFFDPINRGRSGIVCHGSQVLSGSDLANLENLPSMVFFNACEAGRVRSPAHRAKGKRTRERLETNIGLAESFLRGGVANYVGTYWPVGDAPAEKFASAFYRSLLQGENMGAALAHGREQVYNLESVDWADYVHYGSPRFVVKRRHG